MDTGTSPEPVAERAWAEDTHARAGYRHRFGQAITGTLRPSAERTLGRGPSQAETELVDFALGGRPVEKQRGEIAETVVPCRLSFGRFADFRSSWHLEHVFGEQVEIERRVVARELVDPARDFRRDAGAHVVGRAPAQDCVRDGARKPVATSPIDSSASGSYHSCETASPPSPVRTPHGNSETGPPLRGPWPPQVTAVHTRRPPDTRPGDWRQQLDLQRRQRDPLPTL